MNSRHNINSLNESEDEEQTPIYNRRPQQHHDRTKLIADEDSITGINKIENDDRETLPLLAEYAVDPSPAGFLLCTKLPARYAIAIWAFFGFFCLYSMRVNLSVAIVAMVSQFSI